jgi:hypothetical protein
MLLFSIRRLLSLSNQSRETLPESSRTGLAIVAASFSIGPSLCMLICPIVSGPFMRPNETRVIAFFPRRDPTGRAPDGKYLF